MGGLDRVTSAGFIGWGAQLWMGGNAVSVAAAARVVCWLMGSLGGAPGLDLAAMLFPSLPRKTLAGRREEESHCSTPAGGPEGRPKWSTEQRLEQC